MNANFQLCLYLNGQAINHRLSLYLNKYGKLIFISQFPRIT